MARLQLFIKLLRYFKALEKNSDALHKELYCTDDILALYEEINSSKKIKKLLKINKSSHQFHRASTIQRQAMIKNPKTNDIGIGDAVVSHYEQKKFFLSNDLMHVDKKHEIINITAFDQSDIKSINKFYSIFSEADYVKQELMKQIKKVFLNFFIKFNYINFSELFNR